MPHEHRANAVLTVEARLERQQAQHEVYRAPDGSYAPLPPCPDLRTHILDGRDTRRLETGGDAEIELGRVDADVGVRPLFEQAAHEFATQPDQPRQVAQDLGKTHDCERLRALPRLAAGRGHPRSGDPEIARPGGALRELGHERRTQVVA